MFLSSFTCLYNLFKVFNFICFDLFLLMLKNSKWVLLLQKNNRLFSWRFMCRAWSCPLSLKIWYPLMSLNALWFCLCYKICCCWYLPQEQPIATSLAKSVSELFSVFFSAIMDSTPPTLRRVKSRAVRSGGRLEGWFSSDNDLIERYRFETSTKVINNRKVVCFDWLESQKLDNVRMLLKDQSLRNFLEMKGNIYPDLWRTSTKFNTTRAAWRTKMHKLGLVQLVA